MMELLSVENIATLLMLIFLQAVLGFDNLLYISLESKRVEESKQNYVRKLGIAVAIILRIILLFVIVKSITYFQNPFFEIHVEGLIEGSFNFHSFIVIAGGVFIVYTAIKEISHMLIIENIGHGIETSKKSVARAITMIVLMNLVFSFDSILSAIALTEVFAVMTIAIIISGVMMICLAEHVAEFLKRNRMYEVLGLFILFIVGIMLLSEGGHLAHLRFFGYEIEAMTKSTFYFVIVTIVLVEIAQTRYQKKLRTLEQKS